MPTSVASGGLILANQFMWLRYRFCEEACAAIQAAEWAHPHQSEKHFFAKALSSRAADAGFATKRTGANGRHGYPFEAGQF
jgi:hypothetical protein